MKRECPDEKKSLFFCSPFTKWMHHGLPPRFFAKLLMTLKCIELKKKTFTIECVLMFLYEMKMLNWKLLSPPPVKAVECISLYKQFSAEDVVVTNSKKLSKDE